MSPHQAAGAYRRWQLPSFDAPAASASALPASVDEAPPAELPPAEALLPAEPPQPLAPPMPEPVALESLAAVEPEFQWPTADDIERIHEEARKEGYASGYDESTARGRVEAMHFNTLVQNLETALTTLDQEVAEEILTLSIELARQMVRHTLAVKPESVAEMVREALLQLPQGHATLHVNPEDLALIRDYLGEQLSHGGHRLMEDAAIARGGVRIDAAGSQIDATLQTRWRRIMDNLGRQIPWDGER